MFRNSASVASFGAVETAVEDLNIRTQPNDKPHEILILGSEGSGKTLLTKRLQGSWIEYSISIMIHHSHFLSYFSSFYRIVRGKSGV